MNRLENIKKINEIISNGKPQELIVLHCTTFENGNKIYTDTNGKKINLDDLPKGSMKVLFEIDDYSNDPRMQD